MKAMILAAGRGERMRPLTEHTPKPLLKVGGKMLIQYHLEHLAAAGFREVIINIAYLGHKIQQALGNGSDFGLLIKYSEEPEPLETAGAILHALPLLGNQPFLLINGDIWTDFSFHSLKHDALENSLGKLILVANPEHNPDGDFSIHNHRLTQKNSDTLTFSGISLLHPALIKNYPKARKKFPLGEVFRYALEINQLEAEAYKGEWFDIGTVARLNQLDEKLSR